MEAKLSTLENIANRLLRSQDYCLSNWGSRFMTCDQLIIAYNLLIMIIIKLRGKVKSLSHFKYCLFIQDTPVGSLKKQSIAWNLMPRNFHSLMVLKRDFCCSSAFLSQFPSVFENSLYTIILFSEKRLKSLQS